MNKFQKRIKEGKKERSGPQEIDSDWFIENMKKVLRTLPGYTDSDRAEDREIIKEAKTLGELIDFMFYGWSLHEDPSIIAELIDRAYSEYGCVVTERSPCISVLMV